MTYSRRDSPGTSGEGLLASTALPDSDDSSLDGVLSTERADVSRMLCNFHLLDILSEGSTITGSVLSGDTDLSSSLGHFTVLVSFNSSQWYRCCAAVGRRGRGERRSIVSES